MVSALPTRSPFSSKAIGPELPISNFGLLTAANIVRFDADDIWGGDLQAAFFQGVLDYLTDPSSLDSILEDLELVAAQQLE